MIRAFFEGPAGSGKTHQLIEEAIAASSDIFADPEQKLLVLTFMNGARQRLNSRFGVIPQLRGRFLCVTFDSFAGSVTQRRRSLLRVLPAEVASHDLNEFDRTCRDAARLIECSAVAEWVASAYPLVIVDEAQDLDPHRFRLLKAIANGSCVIAAADEFQNLRDDVDTTAVLAWLRGASKHVALTQIRRTSRDGLLRVAAALRGSKPVCKELEPGKTGRPCMVSAGLRVIEAPAKDGLLSWTVGSELAKLGSSTVILTPDATSAKVRTVLGTVQSQSFLWSKKTGTSFGPFGLTWERRDDEQVVAILAAVNGDGALPLADVIQAVAVSKHPEAPNICARLERARNVRGLASVTREELGITIESVLRDAGRYCPRAISGRAVMTVHRAKNREFSDVLILWPQSVGGTMDHQRRLLYNALTRTRDRCSVVIFGQGRMAKPPFAD